MTDWRALRFGSELNNNRLNAELNSMTDEMIRLKGDAGLFKHFEEYVSRKGNPKVQSALNFSIFAKTRPDKISKTSTLTVRRKKNLEIIANAEFLILEGIAGGSLSGWAAERLFSLSAIMEQDDFDEREKVATALAAIGDKLKQVHHSQYSIDADKWIEARYKELTISAKYKPTRTMPEPESVAPTDPSLRLMISKITGKPVNVVSSDFLTISNFTV